MREIEFRAWFKDEKKMYGVSEIHFSSEGIEYIVCCDLKTYDRPYFYVDLKDIELMQYTGLKDKNGVKIFEGDIIRIYGGEKMFGYYEFDQVKVIKELEDLVMLSNLDCGIEVIGNIYENPELLEVKDE